MSGRNRTSEVDSGETMKVKEIVRAVLDDTGVPKAITEAQRATAKTSTLTKLVYALISIIVVLSAAGAGWAINTSQTVGAHDERINGNADRIDATARCMAGIQDAAVEMARSVGRIEGMLTKEN